MTVANLEGVSLPPKWQLALGANLALGVLLWFGLCTDYSLPGTWPDLLGPPVVGVLGFITVLAARKLPVKRNRLACRVACLPSVLGGVLSSIVLLQLALPLWFELDEIQNEACVQRTESPDGRQLAEVYFRYAGAYDSGAHRIFVRVKRGWFPFLERDVYYKGRSYSDEHITDVVRWRDKDTLLVHETSTVIKLGWVKLERPAFVKTVAFFW